MRKGLRRTVYQRVLDYRRCIYVVRFGHGEPEHKGNPNHILEYVVEAIDYLPFLFLAYTFGELGYEAICCGKVFLYALRGQVYELSELLVLLVQYLLEVLPPYRSTSPQGT